MEGYKLVYSERSRRKVRKDIQEVFDILAKYYRKIENGTHALTIPDPFDPVSDEEANKMIEDLDGDMQEHESWRIRSNLRDALPEFSRMNMNSRKAMYQEIRKLSKYQREHPEEYFGDVEDLWDLYEEEYLINNWC